MPTLLHVSASPRGAASESLAIAATYLETLAHVRPDVTVESFDLWDGSLPDFGPLATAAKMAVFAGQQPSGEQVEAWAAAKQTFERFAAADLYLFSVPMWNHGVPYVLKQLIDVISQPGMVFGFDPERGYSGLLTGRTAVVIYTSAVYGHGVSRDFGVDYQVPYLNEWLRWAGIEQTDTIEFRPNLVTRDADSKRRSAHAAAVDAAMRLVAEAA